MGIILDSAYALFQSYIGSVSLQLPNLELKQTMSDSAYNRHKLVQQSEIELVEVYPVPVEKSEATFVIHSKKAGPAFIDLFDLTGRLIFQDRIDLQEGVNRHMIMLPGNEGNTYFLTLYNGKNRISKTIVKSNMD